MKEKLRARCPCCGMMADVDRFEGGPHEVEVFIQRFGGKVGGSGAIGRGRAPGMMEYLDVTASSKDIVTMIKQRAGSTRS